MKKEILFEINRYREIMGLNLLLENGGISLLGSGRNSISALSSVSDDLTGLLKNTDELMDLADDAALMIEYPVLKNIKDYLIQQEADLGRALEVTDITQLNKVDDLILDYFSTLNAMEAGTRNAFIESYLEKSGLEKFKNTDKINASFEEASSLGLRELKGLKDVLKREVNATNLPRYMKDLVIADIEGVSKSWARPSIKNKKFNLAITKSYDDFIDAMVANSTVTKEQLEKVIPRESVKKFKERLITNSGDINKTVTQLNNELNSMITKIEESTGKTRTELFQQWAKDQGANLEAILGFGPFRTAYDKLVNGKSFGENLGGLALYGIILFLVGGLTWLGANFTEVGDSTGWWGDKLSSEGNTLKRKFSNITKVNKFWNEIAVYVKATGKVSELVSGNAIAIEEQVENNLKSEDRFKITFNWNELGQMVWNTDNEGEDLFYEYGSGVFPKTAGDVPNVIPDDNPPANEIAAPTKAEFVTWFNNKFEVQITDDNVTIGTDNITQVTVGSESAKFKKIAEKTFEEIPK